MVVEDEQRRLVKDHRLQVVRLASATFEEPEELEIRLEPALRPVGRVLPKVAPQEPVEARGRDLHRVLQGVQGVYDAEPHDGFGGKVQVAEDGRFDPLVVIGEPDTACASSLLSGHSLACAGSSADEPFPPGDRLCSRVARHETPPQV